MQFSPSCDTMVVMGSVTEGGRPIFAKNSDREPNEAQYLIQVPAMAHSSDTVKCSHIEIPQVERTFGFIGSQPWWLWGLEHGVNEHGLAVGNEAAWSRDEASTTPGLIGMDYVRLALERARGAKEALELVTALLAEYGQSGSCSYVQETAYQNSFIFADPQEAWVLETSGRNWVAKQVRDVASISNVYSIGDDYDLISEGAIEHAVENGWHDPAGRFSWTEAYTDLTLDRLPSCRQRLARSGSLLSEGGATEQLTVGHMMRYLRDHDDASGLTGDAWAPSAFSEGSLCMHAATAEGFETAASMVAELHGDVSMGNANVWASMASPCMSLFVPMWADQPIPERFSAKSSDRSDFWWSSERAQRRVERYFDVIHPLVGRMVQLAQDGIVSSARGISSQARSAVTSEGVDRAESHVRRIEALVDALDFEGQLSPTDRRSGYLEAVEKASVPAAVSGS